MDILPWSKKKTVTAILPEDAGFFGFIYSYEFLNFLQSRNVIDLDKKTKTSYTPLKSPMFPLKFHDDDNFKLFLNDLKDDERRSIIFQDINNSDLVTKNIIHAVILKELGENVFEHSESQIANIIMTKHLTLPPRALPFQFSHTLTETPVISLVISDFGLGIYERLRSAYLDDSILPSGQKLEDPTESDVIKYAFLKHSTSRSDKQRKEKLARRLSSKSLEYPLPTGLYKIKNTVQEHRGILVVRSGKTIVGFDYFSRPGELFTHTNTENLELKKLASFPGTQFNLIFPYRKLAPIRTSLTLNSLEKSKVTHKLVDHISLSSYISAPITDITTTEIDQLQSLLDHFEQLRLKHIKGRNAAILDVDNFANVSEKNIKHIIVTSAMAAQTNTLAIILVNLDRSSFSDLNRDYAEDQSFSYLRPLLAYDILFKPRIVGLQYSTFYNFFQRYQEAPDNSELKKQAEKCRHFLHKTEGNIELLFEPGDIVSYYSEKLGYSLATEFTNGGNNIYLRDQKVLIPNKYYCKGFFYLHNLFASRKLVNRVCTWLSLVFRITQPNKIISVGPNAEKLVSEVYGLFKSHAIELRARHHHISSENVEIDCFRIAPNIAKKDRLCIVTDVIGSSHILHKIIELLPKQNDVHIVTLINAEPTTTPFVRTISNPLTEILTVSMEYHTSLPKGWDYSDIKIFDVKQNRLLENTTLPQGPLWQKLRDIRVTHREQEIIIPANPFLEDISVLPRTWFYGHFRSRGNHILYFFNIRQIVSNFSLQIGEVIGSYIRDIQEKVLINEPQENFKSGHSSPAYLLYPEFNPGMDRVAQTVAKSFPGMHLISVNGEDLKSGLPVTNDFTGMSIVVIDDAFVTGSTTDRLVDISSERGAQEIFCVSLIKRGDSFHGRRFEKVSQYGGSTLHSRYLVDAEIPIFDSYSCPLCIRARRYDEILNQLSDDVQLQDFRELIEKILGWHKIHDVSSINIDLKRFVDANDWEPYRLADTKGALDPLRPYFSKIVLRWKLQVAIENPAMQRHIEELLTRNPEYDNAALMLITILAEEKAYFLENPAVFDKVFLDQTKTTLINACNRFLAADGAVNPYEYLTILEVHCFLDEPDFVTRFPTLLVKYTDPEYFYITVFGMLIITSAQQNPMRVSRVFDSSVPLLDSDDKKETLIHLSRFFKNRDAQIKSATDLMFHAHNESNVKIHNFASLFANMESYLEESRFDSSAISKGFNAFHREFVQFEQRFLDDFLSRLKSGTQYGLIKRSIDEINIKINEILSSLKTDVSISMLPWLKENIVNLRELTTGSESQHSLPSTLKSLRVNVRAICYEMIEQEKLQPNGGSIHFDYFFPDFLESVFGDEDSIILIFKNLLSNVRRHSGATECIVWGLCGPDDSRIRLLFLDNGESPENISWDEGLQSVSRAAYTCSGSFTISRINAYYDVDAIQNEFPNFDRGTVAEVCLSFLRSIEGI